MRTHTHRWGVGDGNKIEDLANGADDFEADSSSLELGALGLLVPLSVPSLSFDLLLSSRHLSSLSL